jgi:DNA-binding CsgD family transcriptional regulator
LEGVTLFISRTTDIFSLVKSVFDDYGFKGTIQKVHEKDDLDVLLNELKPKNVFIHSEFYSLVTPYMIGRLIKRFPKLKINIVNFCILPVNIAAQFILYGVNSYIDFNDSFDEIKRGLEIIQSGKEYYSQKIKREIDLSNENTVSTKDVTNREKQVLRLVCYDFDDDQIVDNIKRSRRTVDTHIRNLYKKLDVKNRVNLLRKALILGLVKIKDLSFHGTDINKSKNEEHEDKLQTRNRRL